MNAANQRRQVGRGGRKGRYLLPLLLLGCCVWLARADQPAYDEVELNRLQLEKWKKDAPHYARLRRSLVEFLQLPADRQEAMRQLDRDLQGEDSATAARLLRVLDRYTDWLDHLPDEDRQSVLGAPTSAERLQRIKQIRDREWLLRQPKAIADELVRMAPPDQAARIAHLRKEEAEVRAQWDAAILYQDQFTRIRSLPEKFTENLRIFLKESLEPLLSPDELKQLNAARNRWPAFEMKLVELADKHPVKLLGAKGGVRTFEQLVEREPGLAEEARRTLRRAPGPVNAEGRWPEYAEAVANVANRRGFKLARPLGPSRPADFDPGIQEFIRKELTPNLKPEEKESLQRLEGKWPAYPRAVQHLARIHSLGVPGLGLPAPRDLWEAFRRKSASKQDFLPELPDRTLLDFANRELTAEERAAMPGLSVSDPQAREEWKRAYFVRHPEILKKLKRQDIRKEKAAARKD